MKLLSSQISAGTLYVVATPIGNLFDMGQRAIAEKLGIAEATVTQRAQKACSKLAAKTRTQAVAIAVARNFI